MSGYRISFRTTRENGIHIQIRKDNMRPTDLIIIDVTEGRIPERVPTFCADLDEWPVQQVLGKPLVPPKAIFLNPLSRFILDRWGKKLKKVVVDPFVCSGMMNHVKAALKLGFDSTWVSFEWRIMMWDSKLLPALPDTFQIL